MSVRRPTHAMSYRSIVVHVDDHPRSRRRVAVALGLAARFDARVIGIYVQPGLALYPFTAAMLPADFVEERMRQQLASQRAAEADFSEAAAAASVMSIEWRAPAGDPYEMMAVHARNADLAVLGQPEPKADDRAFASDLAQSVLMDSGRPVLFVPHTGTFDAIGRSVLVAWKNTREAARAVGDAIPLLTQAGAVRAVSVAADDEVSLPDAAAAQDFDTWLAQHGVATRLDLVVAPGVDAGQWLLSHAADAGADLIVMGGYGHRRLRELVIGGVTRTMLRAMRVPVLMSH